MRAPTLLLLGLLASCGRGGEGTASEGARLYAIHACNQCHGARGQGSPLGLGPTLKGVGEHWDSARLEEYLLDPAGFAASDERLGRSERSMPALAASVTPQERALLIEHVLGLMED